MLWSYKVFGSIFTNPHSKNCFLCAAASALSGLVRDYRHSLGSPLPPYKLTNHRLVLRSRDLSGPIRDQYSGHVTFLTNQTSPGATRDPEVKCQRPETEEVKDWLGSKPFLMLRGPSSMTIQIQMRPILKSHLQHYQSQGLRRVGLKPGLVMGSLTYLIR